MAEQYQDPPASSGSSSDTALPTGRGGREVRHFLQNQVWLISGPSFWLYPAYLTPLPPAPAITIAAINSQSAVDSHDLEVPTYKAS